VRLITGAGRPAAGAVLLFDRPVAELPEAEALALLARLGVAWPDGGLVSNLKSWENILLPLWYHGGGRGFEREDEVLGLLEGLGVPAERVPGLLQASPGRLDVRERRIVGLVRALLRDPEALVLAGQLDGLDETTRQRFRETLGEGARAGRTTLWITSDERSLAGTGVSLLLRQGSDGGVVAA